MRDICFEYELKQEEVEGNRHNRCVTSHQMMCAIKKQGYRYLKKKYNYL